MGKICEKKAKKSLLDLTSFPLTFKIYRLLAWNPLSKTTTRSDVIYFVIAVFYGFLCFVKQIMYFIQHVGDENSFLVLTNNLPCAGFVVLSMAKLIPVYYNRKILAEAFEELQKMNEVFEHRNFINLSFVKNSKNMMTVFTVLFFILIWLFNLMPIIRMTYEVLDGQPFKRQLPYFMWYPFDPFAPGVYEVCYVVVTWGAFTCALGILTSDLLLCSFLSLICMQFDNLKNRLDEIIEKKKSFEILKVWIDRHDTLLNVCEKIEYIFSFSILVNFSGSSIIICLAGFQTVQGNEMFELVKFCLYMVSSLSQIGILCYHGEYLIETSSALSTAIYNNRWYETDTKTKKHLQMVMIRSQKPKFLTTFKFSKVSLNSFMVVIGSSFSYLSFMRSIYSQSESV